MAILNEKDFVEGRRDAQGGRPALEGKNPDYYKGYNYTQGSIDARNGVLPEIEKEDDYCRGYTMTSERLVQKLPWVNQSSTVEEL